MIQFHKRHAKIRPPQDNAFLSRLVILLGILTSAILLALPPADGQASHPTEIKKSPPGFENRVIRKISGEIPAFADVERFQISPDSLHVVYQADPQTDEVIQYYSTPASGYGSPVSLSTPSTVIDQMGQYEISPDSRRVVYLGMFAPLYTQELFSVPIGGGPIALLNHTLTSYQSVSHFLISPDSSTVVYEAERLSDGIMELYSVPISGGTPVKLNGSLTSGGEVSDWNTVISPDSSRVVYRADQETRWIYEVYSVPIGGGPWIKINGALPSYGDVNWFGLSPDGSQVVYVAEQETTSVSELFSAPIGGGPWVKLSGLLPSGGNVEDWGVQISPDSSRVVYFAEQESYDLYELFSAPIGVGGSAVKLNGPLISGGEVSFFEISPDSSRVVYGADQQSDGVYELYSVPIGGGSWLKLNGAMISGGDVDYFAITPDSSRVVYRADKTTEDVFDLFSAPIGGGSVNLLNLTYQDNRDVHYFRLSPDSSYVVYLSDMFSDQVDELSLAWPISSAYPNIPRISGTLADGGDVEEFGIAGNGRYIIYQADQEINDKVELYSVFSEAGPIYLPLLKK